MKHRYDDIENAMMFSGDAFDGNSVYLCKNTGRLYYISEYGDSEEDLPDDLDENGQYLRLPDKHDLDLGSRIVHRFIKEHAPDFADDVRAIFSRKGAYRRFKSFLEANDMLDAWHAYENAQTEAALKAWCQNNGIELTE